MYRSASPAPWEQITTKKQLKEAIKNGKDVEFLIDGAGYATMKEMPAGTKLTVTNHPKRSWFATVEVVSGKIVCS